MPENEEGLRGGKRQGSQEVQTGEQNKNSKKCRTRNCVNGRV